MTIESGPFRSSGEPLNPDSTTSTTFFFPCRSSKRSPSSGGTCSQGSVQTLQFATNQRSVCFLGKPDAERNVSKAMCNVTRWPWVSIHSIGVVVFAALSHLCLLSPRMAPLFHYFSLDYFRHYRGSSSLPRRAHDSAGLADVRRTHRPTDLSTCVLTHRATDSLTD